MAQKKRPHISQKPKTDESPKTGPVVIPKSEPARSTSRSKQPVEKGIGLLFGKVNYLLMLGGIILIALGFILMAGGGSTDPKVFNAAELFSAQRLTVAPVLILLGFAVEVVAIMYKPKEDKSA